MATGEIPQQLYIYYRKLQDPKRCTKRKQKPFIVINGANKCLVVKTAQQFKQQRCRLFSLDREMKAFKAMRTDNKYLDKGSVQQRNGNDSTVRTSFVQ